MCLLLVLPPMRLLSPPRPLVVHNLNVESHINRRENDIIYEEDLNELRRCMPSGIGFSSSGVSHLQLPQLCPSSGYSESESESEQFDAA